MSTSADLYSVRTTHRKVEDPLAPPYRMGESVNPHSSYYLSSTVQVKQKKKPSPTEVEWVKQVLINKSEQEKNSLLIQKNEEILEFADKLNHSMDEIRKEKEKHQQFLHRVKDGSAAEVQIYVNSLREKDNIINRQELEISQLKLEFENKSRQVHELHQKHISSLEDATASQNGLLNSQSSMRQLELELATKQRQLEDHVRRSDELHQTIAKLKSSHSGELQKYKQESSSRQREIDSLTSNVQHLTKEVEHYKTLQTRSSQEIESEKKHNSINVRRCEEEVQRIREKLRQSELLLEESRSAHTASEVRIGELELKCIQLNRRFQEAEKCVEEERTLLIQIRSEHNAEVNRYQREIAEKIAEAELQTQLSARANSEKDQCKKHLGALQVELEHERRLSSDLKRKLNEAIADLRRLEIDNDELKQLRTNFESKQTHEKSLHIELRSLNEQLLVYKQQLHSVENQRTDYQNSLTAREIEFNEALRQAEDKTNSLQRQLKEYQQRVSMMEVEIHNVTLMRDDSKTREKSLEAKCAALSASIDEYRLRTNGKELEFEHQIQKERESHEQSLNKVMHQCRLVEENLHSLQLQYQDLNRQLQTSNAEAHDTIKKLAETERLLGEERENGNRWQLECQILQGKSRELQGVVSNKDTSLEHMIHRVEQECHSHQFTRTLLDEKSKQLLDATTKIEELTKMNEHQSADLFSLRAEVRQTNDREIQHNRIIFQLQNEKSSLEERVFDLDRELHQLQSKQADLQNSSCRNSELQAELYKCTLQLQQKTVDVENLMMRAEQDKRSFLALKTDHEEKCKLVKELELHLECKGRETTELKFECKRLQEREALLQEKNVVNTKHITTVTEERTRLETRMQEMERINTSQQTSSQQVYTDLHALKEKLAAVSSQLQQKEFQLEEMQSKLQRESRERTNLEMNLKEKSRDVSNLQAANEEQVRLLEQRIQEIHLLKTDIQQIHEKTNMNDRVVFESNSERLVLESKVQEMSKTIQSLKSRNQELQQSQLAAVTEKAHQLGLLQQVVQEKDNELEQLRQHSDLEKRSSNQTKLLLDQKTRQVADLQVTVEDMEFKLALRDKEVNELRAATLDVNSRYMSKIRGHEFQVSSPQSQNSPFGEALASYTLSPALSDQLTPSHNTLYQKQKENQMSENYSQMGSSSTMNTQRVFYTHSRTQNLSEFISQ